MQCINFTQSFHQVCPIVLLYGLFLHTPIPTLKFGQ